jgi:pilus assembly protein Flp/PilA
MEKPMDWLKMSAKKIAIKIQSACRDERGVTAIEYGLIAALIAVVIIIAITAVGDSLQTVFNTISSELQGAAGGGGGS